jgi:hypothetical protein
MMTQRELKKHEVKTSYIMYDTYKDGNAPSRHNIINIMPLTYPRLKIL